MNTIPDWIPAEAWAGYIEMRKKMKKPMTDHAMRLRISDLHRFKAEGHNIEEILNQSTANNWTDLYEPKERRSSGAGMQQLGKHGQATAASAKDWLGNEPMDDTLEQKKRFATLLTHLADYYKSELSRAILGIYWAGLRQYSYEAIEKACWAHTQLPDEAGRWMPRNSDIIKMIDGNTIDQAALAWSKVSTAIRVRGPWDDVAFDDALIHRVITDMGGWVKIVGSSEDEFPFVAKEFQTRYRSFRMRGEMPEYPSRLIGIANAHNSAQSKAVLPVILIGDRNKAIAVIKNGSDFQSLGFKSASSLMAPVKQLGGA